MFIIKSPLILFLLIYIVVAEQSSTYSDGQFVIDELDLEDSDRDHQVVKRVSGPTYYVRVNTGATARRPRPRGRPFASYGPPHRSKIPSLKRPLDSPESPWSDAAPKTHTLEVPFPIRDLDFREDDPIASQNSEPFKEKSHYLPPKNQQLPKFTPFQLFQQQQPTHLPDAQYNQISDASFFLMKNAGALSKLYESPAPNLNYPPFEDHTSNDGAKFERTIDQSEQGRNYPPSALGALPMNIFHARKVMKQLPTSFRNLDSTSNRLQLDKQKFCGGQEKKRNRQNSLGSVKLNLSNDWNHEASLNDISTSAVPITSNRQINNQFRTSTNVEAGGTNSNHRSPFRGSALGLANDWKPQTTLNALSDPSTSSTLPITPSHQISDQLLTSFPNLNHQNSFTASRLGLINDWRHRTSLTGLADPSASSTLPIASSHLMSNQFLTSFPNFDGTGASLNHLFKDSKLGLVNDWKPQTNLNTLGDPSASPILPITSTDQITKLLPTSFPNLESSYQNHQNPFKGVKLSWPDDWNHQTLNVLTDISTPSASSIPTAASPIPPSHVLDLRPQGNTPSTVFPYPQNSGLLPLFGTSFNLGSDLSAFGIAGGGGIYEGVGRDSGAVYRYNGGQIAGSLGDQSVFANGPTEVRRAFPK